MRLEGRGKWGVLKVEAEGGSDDKGVADSVKKMGLYFTKKESGKPLKGLNRRVMIRFLFANSRSAYKVETVWKMDIRVPIKSLF